ncbi:MAG: hypothetical protein WBH77_09990 [Saccharofermentanales bacterium]
MREYKTQEPKTTQEELETIRRNTRKIHSLIHQLSESATILAMAVSRLGTVLDEEQVND